MRAWTQIRTKAPRLGFRGSDPIQPRVEDVRDNPGFRRLLQSRRDQWEHHSAAYHPEDQQVTLLNEPREFGERIDWECRSLDVPLLWQFHLHYHEFLLDLLRPESGGPRAAAYWTIVEDWIHNNKREDAGANEAAWHPY